MQATMALFSPPSNLFSLKTAPQTKFAQSIEQLKETIFSGFIQDIICSVAQRIWFQNRVACEKNNLFCQKDIQNQLSLELYNEATKNVDEGILGLKCPQSWSENSFSTKSYVYKIVYYLALRCIYCSQTLWNGLPLEEYRIHYALLLEEDNTAKSAELAQERSFFFKQYIAYFKPLSDYFLAQSLLSPSAFFIFGLFHFPQELTQQDWTRFLPFFLHAQPAAFQKFQDSPFQNLSPEEGSKFTSRIQFISWLLLGSGYADSDELKASPQAAHFYTNLRQSKNSARDKIFRYLLCLLLSCDIPSLQEIKPEWERLLYKSLKLNPLLIIGWKQRKGTMEDLYAIIFTPFQDFQQYRASNHLANHQYRHFVQRFTTLQFSFQEYWEQSLASLSN